MRSPFNQELDKNHLNYTMNAMDISVCIWSFLDEDYCLSRERAHRRMHKRNLKAKQRKKYKHTTDSNHNKPVAQNILNRNFTMNKVNQAWVCHITYIRINQQWIYLAIVLDLYSRKSLVGQQIPIWEAHWYARH